MSKKFFARTLRAAAAALCLSIAAPTAFAQAGASQSAKPRQSGHREGRAEQAATDERAEAVLRRAVDALGGGSYLGVRSMISRGYFTPFTEGVGGLPVTFLDYLVFPDRERTEFKGRGVMSIQSNTGETGWLFDGKTRKISDATPEQVRDFRTSMRTSLDNVLRGWWRTEGAALTYVGRREAGLARRNEVVRLTYADGFVVEFEFGAKDNLPSKARYKKEAAGGETIEEEDHYAQFQLLGGVRVPFIIDHYRAGVQSSRVNYQSRVHAPCPIPSSASRRT